jgi:hypothetical protein
MPSNLISPLLWQSVSFGDEDAYLDWLGQHGFWHDALAAVTATPRLNFDDLRLEMLRHANVHAAVAKALGVPVAPDLASYDLRDRESFVGFMQTHALDHQRLRVAAAI